MYGLPRTARRPSLPPSPSISKLNSPNKTIQAELARLRAERDDLWRQLEGSRRELEGFRQGLARAGREKADLEAAYRAACEEAERCVFGFLGGLGEWDARVWGWG